jgi:hypothetical protein
MNLTKLILAVAGSALVLSPTLHAGAPGYELKNRSAFRGDAEMRVPFWPIGYKKPNAAASRGGEVAEAAPVRVQLQASQFKLTSILLGNLPLATINGRSFAEGELLPVVYGGERLRVAVRAIRDGGVWLDHEGAVLFVPLNRGEIGQKRSETTARPAEFTIDVSPKAK